MELRTSPTLLVAFALLGSPLLCVPQRASGERMTKELHFRSGDATLVGTLTMPKSDMPVPAIVATHAASAPTRDFAIYRHLAEQLPALGFAVLVYDRRGSGASGGDAKNMNLSVLADDAIAAQRALANEPGIDAHRIGVWGLSQGGWLTILAASRNPTTAFVISISGPAVTPAAQMNFATANLLALKGVPRDRIEQVIRARRLVDDHLRGRASKQEAQAAVDVVRDEPWFADAFLDREVPGPEARWAKDLDYDPLAPLRKLKMPVLILYGAQDPWVPVAESVEALRPVLAQMPNVTLRVLEDVDHEMISPARTSMNYDKASGLVEGPNSTAYFLELGYWLGQMRAR